MGAAQGNNNIVSHEEQEKMCNNPKPLETH